jgi:sporulation protein YlmC with PRC-barrel domain
MQNHPDQSEQLHPVEPGYLSQPGYPIDQGQEAERAEYPAGPNQQSGAQPMPPAQQDVGAQPMRSASDTRQDAPAHAYEQEAPVPVTGPVSPQNPSLSATPYPSPAETAPGQPEQADRPQDASAEGQPHYAAEPAQWVTVSSLIGRPIVDLGSGAKIGSVHDVVLSADRRRIEAFTTRGRFLHGAAAFPARGAHIGADAVTIPAGAVQEFDTRRIAGLPLASTHSGMRLLTDTGRIVGTVKDMRLNPRTGEVTEYEVEPAHPGLLQRLRHEVGVLPVVAVQRHGTDALIVEESLARQYLGLD